MFFKSDIVSFDSEQLILVDKGDREVGSRSKAECHQGQGILHRGFSLFIFNDEGQLLLQRRSAEKRLWPLFWSNSCCSHPRLGETMDEATHRRLDQELGLSCDLNYLYKFRYQAQFGEIGAEHEFCWVYTGKCSHNLRTNGNEVSAWRYLSPSDLDDEIRHRPEAFTPWFLLEWERIRKNDLQSLAHL